MNKQSFVAECLIICGAFFVHNEIFSYVMIILGILAGIFAFFDAKSEKKESRENTLQLIATTADFIASSFKSSIRANYDDEETKH